MALTEYVFLQESSPRRYKPFVARKLIKLSLAISLMSHPCVTGNFSPSPPLQHAAYQTGLATPGPFVNH